MKKTNFTFRIFEKCFTALMLISAVLFSPAIANACEMSCGAKQQISLDENCTAEISAEMILSDNGASCEGATFSVGAKLTLNGTPFISGETITLNGTYIGQELVIEITSIDDGVTNSCWGYIELEDKLAPVIECENVSVDCNDLDELLPTFIGMDCDNDPVITLTDQTEESLCDPDFLKRLTRTYTATDKYGNTSEPCTQTIMVERFDLDAVEYPDNLMLVSESGLECDDDFATDANGNPDPSETDVPRTASGEALYPPADFACNTVVSYSDLVLPEVACVTKVMRTWTISEWVCGEDEVTEMVQIIEIVDDEGPDIEPISDVSVSTTTGYNCQALYLLPVVNATDNCKDVKRIDVSYPGGFISDYDGSEIVSLESGVNLIVVTAYDGCLNSNEETFTVFVEDNTSPVAVCDQNTVVALSSDGVTHVSAVSFDDGSYDECALANMQVKRMDNGDACGEDWDEFGDYVSFCCGDIGNNAVVIFRIYDQAGNRNDCMVNVEVQDKLPPTITCPSGIKVECDHAYDDDEQGLIDAFGDATFSDNCAGSLRRFVSFDLNQCNTGRIIRTFRAADNNGSASCQQVITFVNSELFDGDKDIEWPRDVTINDCLALTPGMATEDLAAVHPDETGRPITTEDVCDMVGADYEDRVFEIFNAQTASCFKIIRTWNVIDWCQRDEDTDLFEPWTYQQVIMVINEVAPTFSSTCEDITKCTFDGECSDGEVILTASATDDCTPDESLAWQFSLDMFNDGTFDSISPILLGGSVDATGDYPIGKHRIIWTVEDRCGNKVSCEQFFTVENCKTPTPYCINGLAIDLGTVDSNDDGVVDGGSVDIWASDFDAGSFHQCGYDVTVSFSSDPTDVGRTYTCADFGIVNVDIWAHAKLPDGTIVQDFCSTYVDVQDNQNACVANTNTVFIAGTVATENEESIDEVKVALDNTNMTPQLTNNEGKYYFNAMGTGGNYGVNPAKSADFMNGVSTIDLVLIQRHILGLTILDSPYKMIAADIDNDNVISAKDLLNLRKAILGIQDEFANNDSWRFVDKAYSFLDASHPLNEQFTEIYDINDLQSDMTVNWIGVKVGDVNASVAANKNALALVRTNDNSLEFSVNNTKVQVGETYGIAIYADNFDNMLAYQHSISLSKDLELIEIRNGALDVNDSNFGLQALDKGIITTSWNAVSPISVSSDEVLYTIVVKANGNTEMADAIQFNSEITKAEAYSDVADLDITLNARTNPNAQVAFRLYQNTPNPFNGITNIGFELPEASVATLSVYDVTGKLMYTTSNNYAEGTNNIELNVSDIGASGILYYTLRTDNHTATKKMVVLK